MPSRRSFLCRLVCLLLTASAWGCASTPELDVVIAESPRGSVYLERIPDRTFQAAHPLKMHRDTLARALRGILIKPDPGLLRSLMVRESAMMPAFTEEEVRFLTPLVEEGLARAASDQQVGFRLIQPGPGPERLVGAEVGSSDSAPTPQSVRSTGFLYAYGRSLYVTLREYRVRPEADRINMANRDIPDRTGLLNRDVSFVPAAAARPESYRRPSSPTTTVVIDYELLAALPPDSPAPTQPASNREAPSAQAPSPGSSTDAQLQRLQEQMQQKHVELEELRKELQELRRQTNPGPRTP
jgi:hypothetical protein